MTDLPKTGAPAQRALENAGITTLKQLTAVTEAELLQLHGMGPKAVRILREALKANGLSFRETTKRGAMRKKKYAGGMAKSRVKTHIILLRGVMPTGKNKVPMAQLREVLANAGFGNARTYIQSGNVLVDSGLSAKEVETHVHDIIKKHIGADLAVVARTGAQLQKVLDENPFKEGYDISRVFFVSFAELPPSQKIKELLAQDFSPEELAIIKNTAYMYIPGTYGRTFLSNNFLEKKLGVVATTRNFNTISKLIEMSR